MLRVGAAARTAQREPLEIISIGPCAASLKLSRLTATIVDRADLKFCHLQLPRSAFKALSRGASEVDKFVGLFSREFVDRRMSAHIQPTTSYCHAQNLRR